VSRRLKQTERAKRRRELYAERLADPYLARLVIARRRKWYDAMRSDPDKLKHTRERKAAWQRAKREQERQRQRPRSEVELARLREARRALYVARLEREGKTITREKATGRPIADAAPFRQWLQAYGELIGETAAGPIAIDLGLVERRVQSVLFGQQEQVALDVVDRALINSGPQVTLKIRGRRRAITSVEDLYPNWWKH
jgi:hypothetical protein